MARCPGWGPKICPIAVRKSIFRGDRAALAVSQHQLPWSLQRSRNVEVPWAMETGHRWAQHPTTVVFLLCQCASTWISCNAYISWIFVNGLKQKKWLDVLDLSSDTIFFVQQTKYNVLSFDLKKLRRSALRTLCLVCKDGLQDPATTSEGTVYAKTQILSLAPAGGTQRFQQEMRDWPMIFQPRKG